MAEKQSSHRRAIETKVIDGNLDRQRLGQLFAFIIAMAVILGGFYLTAQGQSLEGMGSIIGAVVALVAVFVYGKREQASELSRKQKSPEPNDQPPD